MARYFPGISIAGLILCLLSPFLSAAEIPCGHHCRDPIFIPDIDPPKSVTGPGPVKAVEPIDPSDLHETVDAGSNITLTCYYKDPDGYGFRDPVSGADRRERLYDAVRYIAGVLAPAAPRILTILVNPSLNDDAASVPVAYCGPLLIPDGDLLVPLARYQIVNGAAPPGYEAYPDMLLTVNWFSPWHDQPTPPPADRLDLISVLIHELTHGLGFNSLLNTATSPGPGSFTPFDQLIGRADGSPLVDNTSGFSGSETDLISGPLAFLGPEAAATYGNYPPLYAPDPFLQGTSLQHWDPYQLNMADAVMTPSYRIGSALRQYAPFEAAALRDLGYPSHASFLPPSCPLIGLTILEPLDNPRITAGNRVSVTVTAQPHYATQNCSLVTTNTRIEYSLDGIFQGASTSDALRFPLIIQVTEGTHTLRAAAADSGSQTSAETTVTITAIYDPGTNALTLSPDNADFGPVAPAKTARRTFELHNRGTVPADIKVTLDENAAFTLTDDPPARIPPGQTVLLEIYFRPTHPERDYQGILRVTAAHGLVLQAALTGRSRTCSLFQCGPPGPDPPCTALHADALAMTLAVLALGAARKSGQQDPAADGSPLRR